MMSSTENALAIKDLKVHYPVRTNLFHFGEKQFLRAVDGVTLDLKKGETLGLVGESGCGKTSLGKAIIRLNHPTSGTVQIGGVDFLALKGSALRKGVMMQTIISASRKVPPNTAILFCFSR